MKTKIMKKMALVGWLAFLGVGLAGAAEVAKPLVTQQPKPMVQGAPPSMQMSPAMEQARENQQLRMQVQNLQNQMNAMENQLREFRALYSRHTHELRSIHSIPSVYRDDLRGAILRDGGGPIGVVTTRNLEAMKTTSPPTP
jgi:hypothetical protein